MKNEKLTVKIGCGSLDRKMTRAGAIRYGNRNMPSGLKKAGFETTIFRSDPDINGGDFFRINYGKKC